MIRIVKIQLMVCQVSIIVCTFYGTNICIFSFSTYVVGISTNTEELPVIKTHDKA